MKKFQMLFSEPFKFIHKDDEDDDRYYMKNITNVMFNKKFEDEKIDIDKIHFPNKIIKVYWYQVDEIYGEYEYFLICKIQYGNKGHRYIYFHAYEDYTGFDCQGFMRLYISKNLKRILDYAIPKNVIKYINNSV